MSERALITLTWPADRQRAHKWVDGVPVGSRLEFKPPSRTLSQNSKMWIMLTDISVQVKGDVILRGQWTRVRRSPLWWKFFFMGMLGQEREMARDPTDPSMIVSFDRNSTSDLGKTEFSDLIELMYAFGARAGVEWSDPAEKKSPGNLDVHL